MSDGKQDFRHDHIRCRRKQVASGSESGPTPQNVRSRPSPLFNGYPHRLLTQTSINMRHAPYILPGKVPNPRLSFDDPNAKGREWERPPMPTDDDNHHHTHIPLKGAAISFASSHHAPLPFLPLALNHLGYMIPSPADLCRALLTNLSHIKSACTSLTLGPIPRGTLVARSLAARARARARMPRAVFPSLLHLLAFRLSRLRPLGLPSRSCTRVRRSLTIGTWRSKEGGGGRGQRSRTVDRGLVLDLRMGLVRSFSTKIPPFPSSLEVPSRPILFFPIGPSYSFIIPPISLSLSSEARGRLRTYLAVPSPLWACMSSCCVPCLTIIDLQGSSSTD